MAAQRSPHPRSRRCDQHVSRAVPLDRLDGAGPLHPDRSSARWPLHDPFDAIDALDMSRPVDFASGVLVLLLDDEREPVVCVAVRHAPPDQLDPVISLIVEACSLTGFGAVVLGIVRAEDAAATSPHRVGRPAEVRHWADAARTLEQHGIEVLDVLTLQESCWSSMALTVGDFPYPVGCDPRARWFEDDRESDTFDVSGSMPPASQQAPPGH